MSQMHVQLSEIALTIGAVTLNASDPYTWASGYRMPIYNDNRRLLSDASTRAIIASGFRDVIEKNNLKCAVIAGTATSGIPHATTLADSMGLPLVYVRGSAKGHGLKNRIEGKLDPGTECVLIEDVVSTGGSSLEAVLALREGGGKVAACMTIFSYGFPKADKAFSDENCPLYSLFTFGQLLEVAESQNLINDQEAALLRDWQNSPFDWGEKHGFPKVNN
jgi:orotate phosphoribosyltransferase